MNIKEIGKRIIEILSSNKCGNIPTEWTDWIEAIGKRIVEILEDKHGSWGLPKEETESIAQMLLPDIIAFFETDEGKRIYEQWKKEQEEKIKNKKDAE